MTAKKDLKRRIRERQDRTGEAYVVARRAVLAEADEPETAEREPGAIDVVELDDITPIAAEVGLPCTISIARALAVQVPPRTAVERFRDVLHRTAGDPAMHAMIAVALRNEPPPRVAVTPDSMNRMNQFFERVAAGIGGISEGGTVLAIPMQATRGGIVMMMCGLGYGIMSPTRPRVTLSTPGTLAFGIEALAVRHLRSLARLRLR